MAVLKTVLTVASTHCSLYFELSRLEIKKLVDETVEMKQQTSEQF